MIPLLPYEKHLAQILNISEEEYQEWKAITLRHSVEQPAEAPTCGPLVPVLINLAIAVGVTLLSSLLFPARQQSSQIRTLQGKRDPRTSNQRLSPRFGFDSVQEAAQVGQFVPVVIAKRENNLGGVRVAMPLVWSQMLAYNGSAMFRGIFLGGIAGMPQNAWDPRGWAFGNNTLGAYSYAGIASGRASRYSIYWRPQGGRITSSNLIAGRDANRDPGNSQNDGGQDVFAVNLSQGEYKTTFCMTETPSTSKAFGLYGWCPNAMVHRATTTIQPTIVARISSSDKIRTDDDASVLIEIWKAKYHWSMRGGLRQRRASGSNTWTTPVTSGFNTAKQAVSIGDSLRYVLSKSTDANTKIKFNDTNSRIANNDAQAEEPMTGVAASVTGVQNAADSALIPNELYSIGSCWAVLEERISTSNDEFIFISDSEREPVGGGNTMEYIFTVVAPGSVTFVGPSFLNTPEQGTTILPPIYGPENDLAELNSGTEGRYKVCSEAGQIFRMAVASVSAVREFKVCEILIRSRVGITVSSMMGFRSSEKIQNINAKAGQNQAGNTADGIITVSRYNGSGSLITTKTRRYSTFALQVSSDRGATWSTLSRVFGVPGVSGEEVYDYLRIDFPSYQRWEIRLVPVSSWEIRDRGLTQITVLDPNSEEEITVITEGIRLSSTGYLLNPADEPNRKISSLEPRSDLGFNWSDEDYSSMLDGYGRFAEAFPYDNIQTTVGNAPEHEITQVNYLDNLEITPTYQSLAPLGINISASLEFNSLQSFSGYCNNGYEMPRLLNENTKGSTHLFPDWLREAMTNPDLGALPATQLAQIDEQSFREAAFWCQSRNYFYDAVEDEPLNILQWASETAQSHLLKLVRSGGIYYLKKAIEFDEPLDIKAQFNNGNIAEGSFKLDTIDYLTRQPFIVQVKWREESVGFTSPLFARERVANVREVGTSANAPVRPLDLSKWCTSFEQAIDAACYYIRFVTIHNHRISFRTSPDMLAAQLRSGGFFTLDLDVINYDTVFQGFIQEHGEIVSTRPWLLPLDDGTYPALLWDMAGDPREEDITMTDGIASPTGNFFAIKSIEARSSTYEIKKVDIDNEGVITINAFYHPTDSNGISKLGLNWTTYKTDANWVIEL
jgi:hypothetical protein